MASILRAVFRRLGLFCAVLALFSMAGGHWAVLQSVAWAGMLRGYTQKTGSVAAAVQQTFDGEHPCALCREIQTAKAKEQKQSPTTPSQKEDAKAKATVAPSTLPSFLCQAEEAVFARAITPAGPNRVEQPPTPPPRRELLAA